MDILFWIGLFLAISAASAWIVLGNGLDTTFGHVVAYLLGAHVFRWSDEGIRLFVGLIWVSWAVWFVLGLFEPSLRLRIL